MIKKEQGGKVSESGGEREKGGDFGRGGGGGAGQIDMWLGHTCMHADAH